MDSKLAWADYPAMKRILLLCDSGGGNGYRPRVWKYDLYHKIAATASPLLSVTTLPGPRSGTGRASFVQFHHNEVGRPSAPIFRPHDQLHSSHHYPNRSHSHRVNQRTHLRHWQKLPHDLFKQIPISNHSELPAWNYTIPPHDTPNAKLFLRAAKLSF